MKTSLFTFILLAALSVPGFAHAEDENMIYGWDIACRGEDGLKVHAYQSDDDFYIEYSGAELTKGRAWADPAGQYDLRIKALKFETSEGPNVSLEVHRSGLPTPGYGTGYLRINGESHRMHCYARFGQDEESYMKISKQKFPPISEPGK